MARSEERRTTLVGESRHIASLLAEIAILAPKPYPVAPVGETGTGKGVVARLLHRHSGRSGTYVQVPAARLDTGVAESELYGHVRGSFTGADRDHRGWLEEAAGGTLLLDEVQDLSRQGQAMLLEFLDGEPVRRLGSLRRVEPDVRVVISSQESLDQLESRGQLRADLRARFGEFVLVMLPLRERPDDILPLIEHYSRRVGAQEGVAEPRWCEEALELLHVYRWPRNVRELEGVVAYAVVHAMGAVIEPYHLPGRLLGECRPRGVVGGGAGAGDGVSVLRVLREEGGRVTAAARRLGVAPITVRRRLLRLGLTLEEVRRQAAQEPKRKGAEG